MNKINFIDISNVNCWMIYLMPFDTEERSDYYQVLALQKECIRENIFGMGWDIPCFERWTPINKENATIFCERYREHYREYGLTVSKEAISKYTEIKKGDYVITRLKNGHYYVGCVSSENAMYIYKENDPVYGYFSWGGTVEKWVEYPNEQAVPAEIVGRFSQRFHPTIQRILSYRQRLLVISMYDRTRDIPVYSIPKLHIGINNFVRSMNYMELEDLVALFIAKYHAKDGYKLLPSSCKISQQNYEFSFVSNGKKPISCQVKNQKKVEVTDYIAETSYEKIYLFSGLWNDDIVNEKRNEFREYKHLYIISPSELFPVLREECFLANGFYDYESKMISARDFNLNGFEKRKHPRGEKTYSISDDDMFICFVNKDGLFYSAEFDALILSWDVFEGTDYDKRCIETILECLNG